jgi:hypothetical protein
VFNTVSLSNGEGYVGLGRYSLHPRTARDRRWLDSKPRTPLKFGKQKINLCPVTISKEAWFTAENETAGAMIFASSPNPTLMSLSSTWALAGSPSRKDPSGSKGQWKTLLRHS